MQVLVKHRLQLPKKCETEGCSTQTAYGFAGEEEKRCKAHVLAGMVKARSSCTGGLQSALNLLNFMAMTSHESPIPLISAVSDRVA